MCRAVFIDWLRVRIRVNFSWLYQDDDDDESVVYDADDELVVYDTDEPVEDDDIGSSEEYPQGELEVISARLKEKGYTMDDVLCLLIGRTSNVDIKSDIHYYDNMNTDLSDITNEVDDLAYEEWYARLEFEKEDINILTLDAMVMEEDLYIETEKSNIDIGYTANHLYPCVFNSVRSHVQTTVAAYVDDIFLSPGTTQDIIENELPIPQVDVSKIITYFTNDFDEKYIISRPTSHDVPDFSSVLVSTDADEWISSINAEYTKMCVEIISNLNEADDGEICDYTEEEYKKLYAEYDYFNSLKSE